MSPQKILDRRFYPEKTLIIEKNSKGSCAYYVATGSVEVFVHDQDGKEIQLSTIGPEGIFGEMALITNDIRTANVRTLEPTTIVTISPEDFRKSYTSMDQIIQKLLKTLVDRLIESNKNICFQFEAIKELENEAELNFQEIKLSLPTELQEVMEKEVKTNLKQLHAILKKYKHMTAKEQKKYIKALKNK